jgi:hypothetical protein
MEILLLYALVGNVSLLVLNWLEVLNTLRIQRAEITSHGCKGRCRYVLS